MQEAVQQPCSRADFEKLHIRLQQCDTFSRLTFLRYAQSTLGRCVLTGLMIAGVAQRLQMRLWRRCEAVLTLHTLLQS